MSAATLTLRRIGHVRPLAMLPPKLRRWIVVALVACLVLVALFHFWLRDSSFVTVEKVTVTGLTTKDAGRVRAALTSAAHGMTTLHVRQDELEEAIVAYPVVRALDVKPDFPHGLQIRVIEYRAAALVGGLPVAGDGTILRGLPVEGKLPTIPARGNLHGAHLKDPGALHAARVAGGAPATLRHRLESVELRSDDGIVVIVRDGPELIFGDATRVHAKWMAAVRVLADPDAAGASYIDVRLPGRPAAGGLAAETLAPVDPAGTAELAPPAAEEAPATTVDPATEELAPATGTTTPESTPQTEAEPTDPTGAGGVSPPSG
jgi:cell division protein FtsQ